MNQTHGRASGASALERRSLDVLLICHPDEVVDRAGLDLEEKRAILAAWASDAHAVEGAPALRQLDSGAIVHLDEVLAALRRLDRVTDRGRPPSGRSPSASRRRARRRIAPWTYWLRRRRDDDEGPPPGAPAVAVSVAGL